MRPDNPRGRGTGASRRAKWAAVTLLLAIVATSSGCGYSLAGRGAFLPDYIRVISVPTFVNHTTVFDVEQELTQAVRQEFIGRGKYKVIPETVGADAVLTGEVNSVTVFPSAFNEQQQATRYAVAVVMKFEFKDMRANKVLWENPSLLFREEYELPNAGAALDAVAFFGQESNALERLSSTFAKSVVASIVEAF